MDSAVRIADRSEAKALLDTLTLAFAADPMARYWWREPSSYLRDWGRFALAMGERGFDHNSVLSTADRRAVSFWLPPSIEPDPAQLAALDLGGSAEEDAISFELQSEQARYHPHESHWYLWLIGVDPALRNQGVGSRLLSHMLRTCDERGETAFLESSDPRNIPFYLRHGFEQIGEIRVRDLPVLTPMLRRPR